MSNKGYCGRPLGEDERSNGQIIKRAASGLGTDQEIAERLKNLPKDCGIKFRIRNLVISLIINIFVFLRKVSC